jgi:signal peptidase I
VGSRGRPRGATGGPTGDAPPTAARRAGGPAGGRTRAERRKLQRKVKRRRRRSAMKEIPLLVGVAVLIALVLKTFLVQAFVIPSGSMEQTIRIGDRVLVDKLTPWFGAEPQRGDVVVFRDPGGWLQGEQTPQKDDPVVVKQIKEGLTFIGLLPSDDEKDLIKRVVGVGGPGRRQRSPAGRGLPPPRRRPLHHPLRRHRPRGAAVGDGRPPVQLGRLPRPPGPGVRRHGLRGPGGRTGHGHRLAVRPLEHAGGAGHLRVRGRRGLRVGRRARPVA